MILFVVIIATLTGRNQITIPLPHLPSLIDDLENQKITLQTPHSGRLPGEQIVIVFPTGYD